MVAGLKNVVGIRPMAAAPFSWACWALRRETNEQRSSPVATMALLESHQFTSVLEVLTANMHNHCDPVTMETER